MGDIDYLDEFDVTANLPDNFEESLASKKWTDRKDALQNLLGKITEHPKLATKASYGTLLEQLKQVSCFSWLFIWKYKNI